MRFFKQLKDFYSQNKLLFYIDHLTPIDGLFICTVSKRNVEETAHKPAIMLRRMYIDVYARKWRQQIAAVRYFIRLNKIHFNPVDDNDFATYLGVVCYLVAFYLKRIRGEDIKSVDHIWGELQSHITIRTIKHMYKDIFRYLEEQGMDDTKIKQSIYGHEGIEYILNMLNTLERMHRPKHMSRNLEKKLRDDILDFRGKNPLAAQIGREMEEAVNDELEHIRQELCRYLKAGRGIILQVDTDPEMKKLLRRPHLKVPDYLFVDNRMRICALDSKFSLQYAENAQVSAKNTRKIIEKLEFPKRIMQA